MIKPRLKKKRMKKDNLFYCFILSLFIFSCGSEPKENVDNSGLPYIGHHDVVYEEMEGYQPGDTIYHTVPDFIYLSQDSTYLKSKDISDKIWIAKFFFTHCPTICPPMTSAMKEVNTELEDVSNEVAFLSFSIDPDRDTPSRLRTYIERHGIKANNWYFLTGDESETHQLGVDGFRIHAEANDASPGGFAHSPNFVLVDKNQHIRGVYDGLNKEDRERLITDVRKLLEN